MSKKIISVLLLLCIAMSVTGCKFIKKIEKNKVVDIDEFVSICQADGYNVSAEKGDKVDLMMADGKDFHIEYYQCKTLDDTEHYFLYLRDYIQPYFVTNGRVDEETEDSYVCTSDEQRVLLKKYKNILIYMYSKSTDNMNEIENVAAKFGF